MDWVLLFFRKLSRLIRREKFEKDLEEEIAFHCEQAEQKFLEAGMTPAEARYAAIRQLGNASHFTEQSQEIVAFRFETVIQDFRYALRQLRRNPGFVAVAVLILALGIGASTAIFSAVNPILLESLPYPDARRVVMIWEARRDGSPLDVTFGTFCGIAQRSRSFDAIAVMKPWQPTMIGAGQPERFEGQRVSASYFPALGIRPVLGRDFQASDDRFRGPNVVILSDGLWRRRFAGDGTVVGRQVTLDDNVYTVIGVMPASFKNVLAPSAELWAPLQYNTTLPPDSREWGHHLLMVGRLQSHASRDQARSELSVILRSWTQMHAKGYDSSGGAPTGMLVNPLQSDVTRGVEPALLAILGAVILVLLMACVNVTNLLLARGAQRRGEFAMRAALGAEPARLVRQLLTESLVLATIGGALGMLVAQAGVRALVALSPPDLPRLDAIRVDGTVFAFALGVTALVGLAVGLIPALHASRGDLLMGMRQVSRRTTGGQEWTRHALVISEVALALILLVSAGLLMRSLSRLFAVDPGFDASHLLSMQVQEYGHRFDSDAARNRFFDEALQSVRRVPGVTAAAFTSQLPLSGDYESYGVEFEAYPNENGVSGFRYAVNPEYFEAMKIPLRRGRLLADSDRAGQPIAVMVSESFARRKFGSQDPIGQRVRIGPDIGHADRPWAAIVGVVGDVKQSSLAVSEPDAFYITPSQWAWADDVRSLVVRTQGDAGLLAPAIRQAIWAVDKDQPIVRVATMESLLTRSEAQRRFALVLFAAFALVGLGLAASGIYGVLSGSVNERTREIGIRSALGASRKNIRALVLRQGMALTGVGLLIGLAGATAASQALITLLFGVSRLDPITYLGVMALLLAVAVIACWVPARRAAQVDPAITLRAE
jgi:putative ABC transport system permease protein